MKTIPIVLILSTLCVKGGWADEDSESDCKRLPFPGFSSAYLEIEADNWFLKTCPRDHEFVYKMCECRPRRMRPGLPKRTRAPNPTVAMTTKSTTTTTTTVQPTTKPEIRTTSSSASTTTITTTTSSTTRTTRYRMTRNQKRICEGCKMERGVGYVGHETDCNKYVMCYPVGNSGQLKGETRQCTVGQYWDQSALTCRSSLEIPCKNDKCALDPTLYTYGYEGDCRGYWKCENGVSVGNCCPRGQAYKHGVGCVEDITCNTLCDSTEIASVCDKRALKGNPSKFQQKIHGGYFVEMSCPAGLVFSNALCECGYGKEPTTVHAACKKELDIAFDSGVRDISGNGVHVEAINVTVNDGKACFNGDGALVIPRFANAEIGENLEIKVRYSLNKQFGKRKRRQALLYNGDCDFTSTMVIAVDSEEAYFGLSNDRGRFKHIAVTNTIQREGTQWNEAKFTFHNNNMEAVLNDERQSTKVYGKIARSRCGLKIGWGKDLNGFHGCIDKISISFCPPEKNKILMVG